MKFSLVLLLVGILTLFTAKESIFGQVITGQTFQDFSVDQNLQEAYNNLHLPGSAQHIKNNFPDLELVYTEENDPDYPSEIFPFEYYYSEEVDKTFNLCAIDRTVFICDGKLNRKINKDDEDSGRCTVTPIYNIK